MATQRDTREWALQLLFSLDMNPVENLDPVFQGFWAGKNIHKPDRRRCEQMVWGVLRERHRLDEAIGKAADNWDVQRIAVTDRNVMRLAVYEMLHMPEVPPVVAINEAVDIAKYFGTAESGRFVNGILDRISRGLDRPLRTADA